MTNKEIKALAESLTRAIEQAEHKPGEWAETSQSMGQICSPTPPFDISKKLTREETWGGFGYKRDSWLAVAAVNALPQLLGLIAENESLAGLYKMHQESETREMRDLRAELAASDAALKESRANDMTTMATLADVRAEVETLRESKRLSLMCLEGQAVSVIAEVEGLRSLMREVARKLRNTDELPLYWEEPLAAEIDAAMSKAVAQ